MPSRKSYEQVMMWLNSKAADCDSLDGINAQLAINIINEYREQLNKKGIYIRRLIKGRTPYAEYSRHIME